MLAIEMPVAKWLKRISRRILACAWRSPVDGGFAQLWLKLGTTVRSNKTVTGIAAVDALQSQFVP
jgi:hypothetical protein